MNVIFNYADEARRVATYIRDVREAMSRNPMAPTVLVRDSIIFSCMASILEGHRKGRNVAELAADLVENG